MKNLILHAALLITTTSLLSQCGPPAKDEPVAPANNEPTPATPPLAAIQNLVDSYAAAFEARNIEALAAHWSADGVYQTADGTNLDGRPAIADALKKSLSDAKGAKLIISLNSLDATADNTATGTGTTFASVAGSPLQQSSYTAVFKQENGQWKLSNLNETASSSDTATPSQPSDALKPFAWMIGTWVDQEPDSTVYYDCTWGPGGSHLIRSFAVATKDGIQNAGHEIIGWDDAAKKLQSRSFDADGNVTEAEWSAGDGDTWIRKSTATLAGGKQASSVHKIRKIDDNSYGLKIVNQTLDGQAAPDIEEVTVVRVDPEK
jgi:uncharacterized protein (TIGR02246 family)